MLRISVAPASAAVFYNGLRLFRHAAFSPAMLHSEFYRFDFIIYISLRLGKGFAKDFLGRDMPLLFSACGGIKERENVVSGQRSMPHGLDLFTGGV